MGRFGEAKIVKKIDCEAYRKNNLNTKKPLNLIS
jgi:hypothetical protein